MKKIRNHKIWITILIVITLIMNISIVLAQEYNGYISNVSPSSFEGGVETTVTVTVYNSGESGTLIVDPRSWPSGWDVDDDEFDGNDDIQKHVSSGSSGYFNFKITAPKDGGSGTITWDLYFDRTWPYSNVLLDTYSQYVNANPTTNYNGVINSASPSSFNGGVESAVEVVVYNYGDSGTLIVEPASVSSGWSVDDGEFDGNDDLQIYVSSGSSETFEFYITPPANGGTGTISWKLYYDVQWPDPNILLDSYSQSVSATEGTNYNAVINSVSPNSFNGGEETAVQVSVYNYGDTGTLIVDPNSWPDGWAIDDGTMDGNDDIQITVPSGSSQTFTFYITPPDVGGSGTITWGLYYDIQWPDDNILLDTYSQSVSATEGTNYNAVINSVTPNSFNGGEETAVQVSVYNYGDTGTLIVDPNSWPDGWTIDDGTMDGNDDIQLTVPSGSSQTFTFYITPPDVGGSGTIKWELYYDIQWPDPNILLDTYTQSVAGGDINYEASITKVTPNTFTGNTETVVTVTVFNSGISGKLIVQPYLFPDDWKIDDDEIDLSNDIQKNVPSGSYQDFEFTITPPLYAGAEVIIWKLYYDIQWPDDNILLDTYSQSVTSSGVESTADFYFIHMTDIHIGKGDSTKNFNECIEYINNLHPTPAFVIISGDNVDIGITENYQEFVSCLNKFEVPYHICPGNHDYYDRFCAGISGINNYYRFVDPRDDYSFQYENTYFLSLNSGHDSCEISIPRQGSGLSNNTIDWLNKTIDDLDGSRNYADYSGLNKVIFLHHPIINYGGVINDHWGHAEICNNKEEFLDICDKYDVNLILSGHTHQSRIYYQSDDGININGQSTPLITTETAYVQTGSCEEGQKFRKIVIQGDDVIVCDTTKLREYKQFRVYCPVDIYLIDENGKSVGEDSSEIENVYYHNISYGDYDEKSIIVYGNIGKYSVFIEGKDEGEFRLEVSEISANKTEIFEYEDITVNQGSKANIQITGGSIDSDMVLDYDGDGIEDQQIPPSNTYIYISESPNITITYPLDMKIISQNFVLNGTVQPDSIINVEIKVDNEEWKKAYGNENWEYPIILNNLSNGNHKITARAWDGNEHAYDSVNIVIDKDGGNIGIPGFESIILFILISMFVILKRRKNNCCVSSS